MKSTPLSCFLIAALVLVLWAHGPACAGGKTADLRVMGYAELKAAQGSALPTDYLTYQGELLDDGVPVEGVRDFVFSFWDAASAGTLLSSVGIEDVPVSGGRFAVPIYTAWAPTWNFVYLQVAVADSEGGPFEILGRQQLSAAPYARWAHVAGEAELPWSREGDVLSYFGRVAIGTTTPSGRLHLQGGADDELSLYGTGGVPMLHFRNEGNARDWVFRHDGTNFHLQRETAPGQESMSWEVDGDVGVGVSSPAARLDVARGAGAEPVLRARHTQSGANNAQGVLATVAGSGSGGASAVAVTGLATATSGSTIGVLARSESSDGIGLFAFAPGESGSTTGVLARSVSPDGIALRALASAASGSAIGVRSEVTSALGYAGYFSGGRNYFSGPVGLGTLSPDARLHVAAPAASVPLRVQLDGGTKLKVDSNGGVAVGANATPPANGLFVQGGIAVPATTRWLSIAGRTFTNERSDVIRSVSHFYDGLVATGASGNSVHFSAAVQLPQGAVISELMALVTDLATVENVRVRLIRWRHADVAFGIMAETVSSNAVLGQQTLVDSSISSATVDNQTYAYAVHVDWTLPAVGDNSDLRLNTVRIAYNVTSPLP